MNALLWILFSVCGIMFSGNGLPYGDLFSKYQTRDDYYEDYYLSKIPKLRTTPEKVKEFFINHLSWFPIEEGIEENGAYQNGRSSLTWDVGLDEPEAKAKSPTKNFTTKMKEKFKHKLKNFTECHHIPTNWTGIRAESSKSMHKVQDYLKHKHIKEMLKNATHPLRYRGSKEGNHSKHPQDPLGCYKYYGPSVRIHHPKGSHVQTPKTTTTTPNPDPSDLHFSYPRKIKVIIDLKAPEKSTKPERNANDRSYLAAVEGDSANSTKVLETAGGMASDLAGRVTSLWHCVLGSHRIPETRDVKFYLYTRRNVIKPELLKVNYDLINRKVRENPQHVDIECADVTPEEIPDFERISDKNRDIIRSNFLNIRAPTKILIHGYTGSYKDSRMAKIKDAYLSSGRYNVIQVDWEMLAAPPCYIRVTHHSKFVGETIAQFLNGLHLVGLNTSLIHLVGFSLGAQVAGFAGNNATLSPVCRITGLDPALPLFLHTQPSGRLDRLDAKFVDVIHTCGGILAMLDPLGHVDFYPNGGTKQPGCEFSNLKCSHSRAPQYFAESVISKKKFTGQRCLTWEEFVTGDCTNSTDTSFMGEPCSRRSILGKYYLLTKSKEPFVL